MKNISLSQHKNNYPYIITSLMIYTKQQTKKDHNKNKQYQ